MRTSAAARRYAKALFELAREANQVEDVRGEIDALAELIEESAELAHSLLRPVHPVKERRAVLEAVSQRIGSSALVQHFYAFLIDQRRLIDFETIRAEYARLADEATGRRRAEVVSASPLSDAQRERLERALSAHTGQQIELDARVDPTLVGGAVAQVGDLVFDGSLRTQLQQLRATLTKG